MEIRDAFICRPALYKDDKGNYLVSHFVRKEKGLEYLGIFPFVENPEMLMKLADEQMLTESAIVYLKKMPFINGVTWRFFVYGEDSNLLRKNFEEINKSLQKLGLQELDSHLMDGFDYVTTYFITNEVLYNLSKEERDVMKLYILTFSSYGK